MIDRAKLQQMLGGNPQSVDKFLESFKSEGRKQLVTLQAALQQEDWSMVTIAAHTIKTQCAYLGLDELVQQAAVIEHKAQEKEGFEEIHKKADELSKKLIEVIEKELS